MIQPPPSVKGNLRTLAVLQNNLLRTLKAKMSLVRSGGAGISVPSRQLAIPASIKGNERLHWQAKANQLAELESAAESTARNLGVDLSNVKPSTGMLPPVPSSVTGESRRVFQEVSTALASIDAKIRVLNAKRFPDTNLIAPTIIETPTVNNVPELPDIPVPMPCRPGTVDESDEFPLDQRLCMIREEPLARPATFNGLPLTYFRDVPADPNMYICGTGTRGFLPSSPIEGTSAFSTLSTGARYREIPVDMSWFDDLGHLPWPQTSNPHFLFMTIHGFIRSVGSARGVTGGGLLPFRLTRSRIVDDRPPTVGSILDIAGFAEDAGDTRRRIMGCQTRSILASPGTLSYALGFCAQTDSDRVYVRPNGRISRFGRGDVINDTSATIPGVRQGFNYYVFRRDGFPIIPTSYTQNHFPWFGFSVAVTPQRRLQLALCAASELLSGDPNEGEPNVVYHRPFQSIFYAIKLRFISNYSFFVPPSS